MTDTATNETQNYEFSLIGGDLSLDFSNTVGNRSREAPTAERDEHLNGYADLLRWAHTAGLLDDEQQRQLLAEAASRPDDAGKTLQRAIRLREAIYALFSALSAGEPAPAADLALLNRELAEAASHLRLMPRAGGFARDWPAEPRRLDAPLWPVVWSAGDLLSGDEVGKVRECAGDSCGWLFVDRSRNHSRQWCDMRDCGNRAKARRHYQRKKAGA